MDKISEIISNPLFMNTYKDIMGGSIITKTLGRMKGVEASMITQGMMENRFSLKLYGKTGESFITGGTTNIKV